MNCIPKTGCGKVAQKEQEFGDSIGRGVANEPLGWFGSKVGNTQSYQVPTLAPSHLT